MGYKHDELTNELNECREETLIWREKLDFNWREANCRAVCKLDKNKKILYGDKKVFVRRDSQKRAIDAPTL